jgi:hypothetical protein
MMLRSPIATIEGGGIVVVTNVRKQTIYIYKRKTGGINVGHFESFGSYSSEEGIEY